MSFRYPAGVVGATVTPSGPYQNSTASGAWSLAAQANFKAQSLWPTQGSVQGYSLYGWGANTYGQLGLGNTTDYSSPKQVGALTSWLKMSAGNYHCAVIKNDGTLWTWGRNNNGQLGLGNATNYSSPKQVGSLTTWSQIYCGANFCAAITTAGQLWTWGSNNQGQLGLNSASYAISSPNQVGSLTSWLSIACNGYGMVATQASGGGVSLWAWGYGAQGQLGLGNTTSYSSPKQVGLLTNWTSIGSAFGCTLAIKDDGTLWSWGRNDNGQLGLGNTTYFSSPKQVGALTTWSKLPNTQGGDNRGTGAITTTGQLYVWGSGIFGDLGLGNTTSYSSPKQLGSLTSWSNISTGRFYAAATQSNGKLFSWGFNSNGRLGLGNITDYSSPKQIGALTSWLNIASGQVFAIALKN